MTGKQIDRALDIAERLIKVVERWSIEEYPEANETPAATISRVGDRSTPQSIEEYHSFEPCSEGERKYSF